MTTTNLTTLLGSVAGVSGILAHQGIYSQYTGTVSGMATILLGLFAKGT